VALSGLTANTGYCAAIVAENSSGKAAGFPVPFTGCAGGPAYRGPCS
jgi:hypothetical protein